MKRLVKDLIQQKRLFSYPSVQVHSSLGDALRKLDETRSGALVVLRNDELVGLFSERDFARATLRVDGKLPLETEVATLMTTKVVFVTPDYRLDECLAVMGKVHIRHLPVIENERVTALLSMRHIMDALMEDKQFMIDELTMYITGSSSSESPRSDRVSATVQILEHRHQTI